MKHYIKFFQGGRWRYVLLLILMLLSQGSEAIMVLPLNLKQLNQYADRIFLGTVQEVKDDYDEAGRWCQFITFEIEEVLKGNLAATLMIKQVNPNPVTLADGTKMQSTIFAGVPQYKKGEEVVVFLGPTSAIGFTTSVGLEQGTFRVTRDAQGSRQLQNGVQNKDLFKYMKNNSAYQTQGLTQTTFQALQQEPGKLTLKQMRALIKGLQTETEPATYE